MKILEKSNIKMNMRITGHSVVLDTKANNIIDLTNKVDLRRG